MDQTRMVNRLSNCVFEILKHLIHRWKLHLRPKHLVSSHVSDDDIPALPLNKTAVQVLGEFMKYLYRCAQTYIQDTHSPEVWKSIKNDIDFVLTHPNGWEGAQQSDIRRAAIIAGLIEDTADGYSRLQLLTEGEASLHFCLGNGIAADFLKVRYILPPPPLVKLFHTVKYS
jgi:hypothetical protein